MQAIKIGFIGAGNMAGAILGGIVRAGGIPPAQIGVYDISEAQTAKYAAAGHPVFESVPALTAGCETVFLSVKPQTFSDILPLVRQGIRPQTLLVSIAAGIPAQRIKDAMGFDCKVVPAMPNTPLLLGCGATALAKIDPVSDAEFEYVKGLFELAGATAQVGADKLCEVIPVNGSSPAFIYRFAEVLCAKAQEAGIDREAALRLLCQTLIGSARMLLESGRSPRELIDMVCSPGGTTIAAMQALGQNGFDRALEAAFDACVRRARELASS